MDPQALHQPTHVWGSRGGSLEASEVKHEQGSQTVPEGLMDAESFSILACHVKKRELERES